MKNRYLLLKTTFTVLAIILGTIDNSNSQIKWTSNGVAVCTIGGNQYSPKLISDSKGGAIITWTDKRGSYSSDIYAQRIDSNGNALWTTDGVVICSANDYQQSPQLVSDGAGGAIIIWEDLRKGYSNPDIYAQRVDSQGNVLWTTNGVAVCLANSVQTSLQLVSDGFGGAIITWFDFRSSYSFDIYAQRIDRNGNMLWTTNGIVICDSNNDQKSPQLVRDDDGGAIITWEDNRIGSYYDIYAQRVDNQGNVLWTTNGIVICDANNDQKSPQLVRDDAGGAIITWEDNRSGSYYDIYAQRVDNQGNVLWKNNGIVICDANNDQKSPQLVRDDAGGAIITWEDKRSNSYSDIYAQRVNTVGNVLWKNDGVEICTSNGNQEFTHLKSDGSSGAIILWNDNRFYRGDIYGQRVNYNGGVVWAIDGALICKTNYNQYYPQLVNDDAGGAIISWTDNRSTSWDIYAQRINDQGLIIIPNGKENWAGGSTREIQWVARTGFSVDHITILYSTDSGGSYPNIIIENVPNDGWYNWSIPNINTANAKVKLQSKNISNIILDEDESDENFTIDSTMPDVFNLFSPANGAWTTSSPTFTWEASSDALAGLLKYQLWINGVIDQDSISVSLTSCTSKAPLSEGFHTWNIKAIDKAGNERISNQTWTVRVDGTSPAAFNLLTPVDGIWTNNTQPTFTWQASSDAGSGLNKYQLFIDGSLKRDNIPPSITSTTPPSALSSADHNWYIVAIDNVNNTQKSNQTWMVRIDNTPPTAFNLISLPNDIWTGNTTPTFTWQAATDAGSGLLKYELWVDGVVKIDSISSNNTSATLDPSKALTNGNHTWYVKAYDKAKNIRQSSSTWTLKLDTIPPSKFSLLSPPDSGFANIPTPNFSWNATTDAGAGISHYQLWIDGALNLDNITTTTSSPATPLTEGPHSWFVKAVDKVGNKKQSDQTWTVFGEWNLPQQFDLAAPKDGDTVTVSQPTLFWHPSNDVGSGILKYQLWIDGLLNRDNITASDTSAIPTSQLPNGTHNWFVKAFDRALNSTSSNSTWKIVVDRDISPPISNITDPVNGQTIGGTSYKIKGTADDGIGTGVKVVHVSVNGGATWYETKATTANFNTWEWEWKGFTQGSYTIKSRATDVEGNVETPKPGITVNVDISKPVVKNIVVTPNPTSSGTIQITMEFEVGSSGLNYSAVPSVTFTPENGSATPFIQTSYSAKTWRGTGTIAATENNGTSIIAVSGATDNLGNVMNPNTSADSFVIDTHPPQAFNLISPVDSGWVNSALPTFTWGAANDTLTGIGKYQLWIDGVLKKDNIPAISTSTTPSQNLSLGEHIWFIKAFDLAGNIRNSSSTCLFNMDFQAPTSQITAPSNEDTLGGTSYSVRGTASDGTGEISGVIKVEISINNGPWQTTVNTGTDFSSWSYEWTGFSTGNYTLKSRATDRASNIGSPSSPITVFINQSVPIVKDILVTPNPAKSGTVEIKVNFEVNSSGMNNSINPVVTFTPFGSQTKLTVNKTSYSGPTWIGNVSITANINNGLATIQVSGAKDNYGNLMEPNENAGNFTIDTVSPIVQSTKVTPDPAKAGDINVVVNFTETTSGLNTLISPTVSFTSAGSVTTASFYQTGYNANERTWDGTAILTETMNDGVATIQVKGVEDLAGNVMIDNNNAGSFLIDITSPTAFELSTPSDSEWIAISKPSLHWNASTDATSGLWKYQLYINENLNVDNIPPNKTSTVPASDLTDGAFLWYILAHDSALNSTKSNSTWLLRIDTTPPTSEITNLTSGMNVSADTVVIEGTANDGIGTSAGCGVDSVFISFNAGNSWFPTINTGTNFNTWKYNWTGYTNQNYTIKSKAIDKLRNEEIPGDGIVVTQITTQSEDLIPKEFSISQNYPNPFNPETVIEYQLPKPCYLTIKIYNTIGQEIKTLIDDKRNAGYHRVIWDGKDNFGRLVVSGIYLYRIKIEEFVSIKKMVLLQ